MEDTTSRSASLRILGRMTPSAWKSLALTAICMNVAFVGAFWPAHEGLSRDGVIALFILLFCAGLWVTEAMPAFAVSLLAIGLEIALLGRSASDRADWEKYIATWGSPLIWLFFGGFVLAAAAEKTGLDRWMARRTLGRLGTRPAVILLGVMAATSVLSMFISNTATATMMLAVLAPILARNDEKRSLCSALLLGIAMASNVGGMGTIIGTPPNAIAAGALESIDEVDFAEWIVFGVPPAALLLVIAWGYLSLFYLGRTSFRSGEDLGLADLEQQDGIPRIQISIVVATFFVTVFMWLSSPLHGVPTTVVSFIPICALTTTRILEAEDVKSISWDVLLLIAGGLSLGVAIRDTGLAEWIVAQLPLEGVSTWMITLGFCYVMVLLSNLMSHTAAANMLVPLMLAVLGGENAHFVVAAALASSSAMSLPISTPPNAIVYGTQKLKATDLLCAGLLMGLLAPPVVTLWSIIANSWIG